jgi:hypothetical protein
MRIPLIIAACAAMFQNVEALMVTLQWDPNPVEDGIDHYNLKWGFVPNAEDHVINVGNVTIYTITEPWSVGMTVYFVCTAVNVSNLESGPSNEVSFTVSPWNPNAPGHLKINELSK